MLFITPLTDEEYKTLNEVYKNHSVFSVRTRAHILKLSHDGYSIKEIANICYVCRQTVSTCIKNWEKYGIASILEAKRSGRKKERKK